MCGVIPHVTSVCQWSVLFRISCFNISNTVLISILLLYDADNTSITMSVWLNRCNRSTPTGPCKGKWLPTRARNANRPGQQLGNCYCQTLTYSTVMTHFKFKIFITHLMMTLLRAKRTQINTVRRNYKLQIHSIVRHCVTFLTFMYFFI